MAEFCVNTPIVLLGMYVLQHFFRMNNVHTVLKPLAENLEENGSRITIVCAYVLPRHLLLLEVLIHPTCNYY